VGGGGLCGKNKLLPWALEANVNKTTYGPLIDKALYVMLLMWANPLLGLGLGPVGIDFFGPQMVLA